MLVMNFLYARWHGVFIMDVPRRYQYWIVARALLGYFGLMGIWSSVKYIPVYVANCIFFTMPVWVAFYAACFANEPITKYDVAALLFAFAGVVVINNPF